MTLDEFSGLKKFSVSDLNDDKRMFSKVILVGMEDMLLTYPNLSMDEQSQLFRSVVDRMRGVVSGDSYEIFRLESSGDIMLASDESRESSLLDSEILLRKLREELFQVGGEDYLLYFNIGVANALGSNMTTRELLKNASVAKRFATPNKPYEFNLGVGHMVENESLILNSLRQRLERPEGDSSLELFMHYQPQVEVLPGLREVKLVGLEALLRGTMKGMDIYPKVLIPMIEGDNLNQLLTMYVIRKVLCEINSCDVKVPVSVNFTPDNLLNPAVYDIFKRSVAEFGFDSSRLKIEITEQGYESVMAKEIAGSIRMYKDSFGVSFMQDDSQTGASTHHLPSLVDFDGVKVDMVFGKNLHLVTEGAFVVLKSLYEYAQMTNIPKIVIEGAKIEGVRRVNDYFRRRKPQIHIVYQSRHIGGGADELQGVLKNYGYNLVRRIKDVRIDEGFF